MSIFLLGSTGRLGKEILKKLMNEKIQTSILVRDLNKVHVDSEYLSPFEGNPANIEDLDKAMAGCDTIITSLNVSRNSDFPWARLRAPKTLLSDTMKKLLELAPKHGIKKIITVSAWGANESRKEIPFWFSWIINNSNISYGYLDHERQEDILVKSELDWVIVRPVGLSNSQKDKAANISTNSYVSGLMVSRKSVANFIVDNLNNNEYHQKIVTLS